MTEPTYPCDRCGMPRTKETGGTVFAVCDGCWDLAYGRAQEPVVSKTKTTEPFDVDAESRLHCDAECGGYCNLALEIRALLLRAIEHGRRLGVEEMLVRVRAHVAACTASNGFALIGASDFDGLEASLPLPGEEG